MSTTNPSVCLSTSMGDITIELDAENAPISTENFLAYVNDGFYDGTIFHRVIADFMIQGGGMNPDMSQKDTKSPIKNEATNGLSNKRGTVAMARTQVVDSATAQFFINTVDNDFLDHQNTSVMGYGYAVFGKVTDGMETVDKIRQVATGNHGMHQDVPKDSVVIEKATVVE
ncbi:MAG: peptidyl-prolyl cis-trans isomerase A [Desulfuromonas sp.]|nr:MAG: peptidyl-prolyl cis-trans isomerase A [Desulfuromonas sp.]